MNGQIIRRDEADGNTSTGDPHERTYRFAGKQVGMVGNNGGTDFTYSASIADRTAAQGTGAFRNGQTTGAAYADFDQGVDVINSYGQGSGAGVYTARGGESLAQIAADLWGDSSLWYKLAEANGLAGDAALAEGQTLVIPAGVIRSAHNADTFTPYDPNAAIGDTSPTNAKPPKKAKCGVFGQILLVVIALAVTALTQGALSGFFAGTLGFGTTAGNIAGAVVAGAVGSAASQGVGIATGIQDKFSFKSVGLAAVAAGVGAGLPSVPGFDKVVGNIAGKAGQLAGKAASANVASFVASGITRGVASLATQGISVAAGLQSKFDFAAVAVASVTGGLGSLLGGALGATSLIDNPTLANFGANIATDGATLLANAAARSLIKGTSFGDNVLSALPDAIGQLAGRTFGVGGRRTTGDDPANSPIGERIGAAALAAADEIVVSGTRRLADASELQLQTIADAISLQRQQAVDADYAQLNADIHAYANQVLAEGNYTLSLVQSAQADAFAAIDAAKYDEFFEAARIRQLNDESRARVREEVGGLNLNGLSAREIALRSDPILFEAGLARSAGEALRTGRDLTPGEARLLALQSARANLGEELLGYAATALTAAELVAAGFAIGGFVAAGGNLGLRAGLSDLAVAGRGLLSGLSSPLPEAAGTLSSVVGGVPNIFARRAASSNLSAGNLARLQTRFKIFGSPQHTKTPGHAFRSLREAVAYARDPDVAAVYFDLGYNRALGLSARIISPNRRPDVTAVFRNGNVARVEVASNSDVERVLLGRNVALNSQIQRNGFTPLRPRVVYVTTRQ